MRTVNLKRSIGMPLSTRLFVFLLTCMLVGEKGDAYPGSEGCNLTMVFATAPDSDKLDDY